jgi:hypothetical protein
VKDGIKIVGVYIKIVLKAYESLVIIEFAENEMGMRNLRYSTRAGLGVQIRQLAPFLTASAVMV